MNKQRLTPESNPVLDVLSTSELLAKLNKAQGYGKAQVIFALARKSRVYPELMQVVLNEVASIDNQSTIAQFNDSVAMAAAFAVIDEGQSMDLEKLKKIISNWQNPHHLEDFEWALKESNISI